MLKKSIHETHREVFPHENSPDFEAPFPKVLNQNLIPSEVLEAMMPGWGSNTHGSRPVHVVLLFDVYLTGEGLLFDSEKNVISESITQYTEPAVLEAQARVLATSAPPIEWGKSVLLRKRGDSNYGHWFIEALPKLWTAEKCVSLDACIIPKTSGAMKAVMETALKLSAPNYRVIEHSDSDVIFFKQLVFVDGLTHHGTYMSPFVFSKTNTIAPPRDKIKKLFVSRKGAPRNVLNEDQITTSLKEIGFEVIHPGEMTLEQQAEAFAGASHVVGVMGAGLTNIMFCSPNTKVVNLAPATFPDTFFYFIALHRGLDYTEIRGQNQSEGDGWDQLFVVPVDQIMSCLL